jgi:nicotinamide phosphoribosyltransferase
MIAKKKLPNRFDGYNRLLMTDSYNLSHQRLKINTDWEVSHMYNRKSYRNAGMILFGLQQIVNELLDFVVTEDMVREAEFHAKRDGLVFPTELWMRVVNELSGRIPLKVEMLPEGTYCPVGTPFAQVSNTVEGFGELVTWWEGVLMHAWFSSCCATESFHMRNHLNTLVSEFGQSILWKYHSFGFRGHSSMESARKAGMAWNLRLLGTDDFHTNELTPKAGIGSIPALAHKVTQQFDSEYDCFLHAIDETHAAGGKIVAMVVDTYNAWRVINSWVLPLARYAAQKGIHLVFRPDSGDVLDQVIAIYRLTIKHNIKNVTCIVGEGMSFDAAKEADIYLAEHGNVPVNFCFYGIGAGFYKHFERDTHGWAMKTAFSNGKSRMKVVRTNPFKQSIPGVVALTYENDEMVVHLDNHVTKGNLYQTVYYWTTGMDKPTAVLADWDATQLIITTQVAVQKRVKIATEVVALVEAIKDQYEQVD